MIKLHEFFLTFFYCGKIKKAPGTFGSAASVVLWIIVTKYFFDQQISIFQQNIFWVIFLVLAFIYGCVASPVYAKRFNVIDHGSIVLDEVVGQIIALQITFFFIHENYFSEIKLMIFHMLFCFIFFRFFDIIKPSVIGYCDRNLKSGFGVMFDDLLSGLSAAVVAIPLLKIIS